MPLSNSSSIKDFLKFIKSISTIIFSYQDHRQSSKAFVVSGDHGLSMERVRFCNLCATIILGYPSQSLTTAP